MNAKQRRSLKRKWRDEVLKINTVRRMKGLIPFTQNFARKVASGGMTSECAEFYTYSNWKSA